MVEQTRAYIRTPHPTDKVYRKGRMPRVWTAVGWYCPRCHTFKPEKPTAGAAAV